MKFAIAIGIVLAVLGAGTVLAASCKHAPMPMRDACATGVKGRMRYVSSQRECGAGERAIDFAAGSSRPAYACASLKARLATHAGRRFLIPIGATWTAAGAEHCRPDHQERVVLDRESVVYFCAAVDEGGLLRHIGAGGHCRKNEVEVFVAAHGRFGQSPSRPCKHTKTPTPTTTTSTPTTTTSTPTTTSTSSTTQTTTSTPEEAPNLAPTLTVPAAQTLHENATIEFSAAHSNETAVADADSDGGVERLTLGVSHGTLTPGPSTSGLEHSTGTGTAALVLDGTITALNEALEGLRYSPAHDYYGADALELEANDLGHTGAGGPKTATASVGVSVERLDQAPVNIVPLAQTVAENHALTFSTMDTDAISVEDADSEGGVERVTLGVHHGSLIPGPTSGLTNVEGVGTALLVLEGTIAALNEALEGLVYEPVHNSLEADVLSVETDDLGHTGLGGPLTTRSEVSITVTPVVYDSAVSSSFKVLEDGKLEVGAPGLLVGAADSDSPPLPVEAKEVTVGPRHGKVTLEADGAFVYEPEHLYSGTDSFSYVDTDGNTDSNVATVMIDVEKQTFDVAKDDSYKVHENATLNVDAASGVLVNDTDSAGLTLEAILVTPPSHGTLTLNSGGSFVFVPEANFSGTESFAYEDYDGNTDSNAATVTIDVEHIDRAPVNTVPGAQTAESGVPLTFSKLDTNAISIEDVDADGGVEKVTLSAEHGKLTPGSTTSLSSHSGEGTDRLILEGKIEALNEALEGLTYTAEAHYAGSDTLTLETDDLGHTGVEGPKTTTSTISITVLHTNEPPTLTLPGHQEVDESTSVSPSDLVFSPGDSDAITVGDPDADGGFERVSLAVSHGTLKLGHTITLSSESGNESAAVTIEGTIAALDEALEGLEYKPTSEYSGSDELAVEINDEGHTGSGGAKTASGDVAITVQTPKPVPTNPTYSGEIGNTELYVGVAKDGAAGVERSGSLLPSPAQEANGSALTVKPGTIPTKQGGTVDMNEDGTFTYVPSAGFDNGTDTFEYTEKNSRGGEATGTATIKFDGARVWYVNDTAGSNGDGESNSPFDSLSSVSGSAGKAASGDHILLYGGGSSYTGGVQLKAEQVLVGQDEGLTLEGETLLAPGSTPTITNSSGAGITLAEKDKIEGVTVSGTSGAGIAASGVNEFTLDSKVEVEGTSGDGLEVSGGDGTIEDEAAIKVSGASAHSLVVSSRTGGTVTVAGTIEDSGDGISLSNDAGNIAFGGKLTLSTGTHQAFTADDAGTIAATSGESTIATTTATAVGVESTTIGAAGLKFKSISAGTSSTGPSHGIVLEKTGSSGGLDVTGSGSAGSGGTVQHTTGSDGGIYLDETDDDSLADMDVTHSSTSGIYGTQVDDLSVTGSSLANNEDGLLVEATGGTEVSVKATGGDSFVENKEQGFETVEKGSGTMHVTVEKGSFTDNTGTGVDITSESGGAVDFDVADNKLTGQQGNAINVFVDGSGKAEGEVVENEVGVAKVVNTGSVAGDGIEIDAGKSETLTTNVSKNKVFEIENEHGIEAHAGEGSATLNLTLEKNEIHTEETSSLDGILVDSGVLPADTSTVCMNAIENTSSSAGTEAGNLTRETYGFVLIQQTSSAVFEIQGYKGSGTSNEEIDNFLAGKNTLSAGGGPAEVEFFNGFTSAEKCPTVP